MLAAIIPCLILVSILLGSCVDVNDSNIPVGEDLRIQVSFLHLASGLGNATVQVDNQSIGTVSLGGALPASGYLDLPAGARFLRVTYAGGAIDTSSLSNITVDSKGRVVLIADTAGPTNTFLHERHLYEPATVNGAALVRFVNGSSNAGAVDVHIDSVETEGEMEFDFPVAEGLELGSVSAYLEIPGGGTHAFTVFSDGDSVLTITSALQSGRRYTIALYNPVATLRDTLLTDD
jgi:hypothetical protein